MGMIKGIDVILIDKVDSGADPFGHTIFEDREITVKNVLVAPVSSDDNINDLNINGRKIEYLLAIPKGDTNNWENKEVLFFGRRFKTYGIPTEGIESMLPLEWNKKVMVELYE